MPLFSVIIPTFNRAALLEQALLSVIGQKDAEAAEILVVDDGSHDNTLQMLAPYKHRIRILQQQNKGPGAARNLAIAKATGDYVTFLDSDDVWFEWTLQTFRHAIERFDSPSFIAGREVRFTQDIIPDNVGLGPPRLKFYPDYLAASSDDVWIGTCAAAVRREALLAVGGFNSDRSNAEDSDLWLKLGVAPGFVFVESPVLFGYRMHLNSAVSDLTQTLRGIEHLVARERSGHYPGGAPRRMERLRILTRHVRPVVLLSADAGFFAPAWRIYRQTFWWHFQLGRARFLAAFPLFIARGLRRRVTPGRTARTTSSST